jgi:putative transposase
MDVANVVAVLAESASKAVSATAPTPATAPMLVVDGGIENFNAQVDELHASGVLRRVLALTDLSFSNSMIEAWWRTMKHQWLFLNTLDSVAAVRRLVTFYVAAHISQVPHSAFRGQTPDEVYLSTGAEVPISLQVARKRAQSARCAANRATACGACTGLAPPQAEERAVA